MFHFTDRTLEKLISGSASAIEVHRIRRHAEECRACARRLEEWRDTYSELEEQFPDLVLESGASATVTPVGMVMLPSAEQRRRFELDLTTALWIGAALMAVLVGYGATRLRQPSRGMEVGVYDIPQPAGTDSGTRQGAMPALPATTDRDTASGPPVPITPRPAAPVPPPVADLPAPLQEDPRTAPLAISPHFKGIRPAEAAARLGGPLRLLGELDPDHIEVGPASAVPGAQSGLDVIRIVYRAPDGRRILLDQQLIPADSSGFRPIEDPTLESGATAYGTSPGGVTVATWLDEAGYRISLALHAPLDSLKRLVPLVH